ncbi:GNAT family N-acetyltransferase [Streptomyces sp. Q6]|uniref:GNAT family N-acetyltransferase n=1 Tax=Streptomyces citrinus TaxID=3118173 RepID=A0ACD5ANL1_9ACTN
MLSVPGAAARSVDKGDDGQERGSSTRFYTSGEYVAQRIETPTYDPHGVVLALDSGSRVGRATTSLHPEGHAFSEMTGLPAGHRGRGISPAMKLLAIGFARSHGAPWLRTFHHPDNAAAIGMNRRLGFVDDQGLSRFPIESPIGQLGRIHALGGWRICGPLDSREGQMAVKFAYQNVGMPDLNRRGLRPETAPLGVLLVDIEADLVIRDGSQVVMAEGLFPVAELARALVGWLGQLDGDRDDFEFDSMSYADVGEVRIVGSVEGWRVGSVSEPGSWTSPVGWDVLVSEIAQFVTAVREDVVALGVEPGLIPDL